MKEIVRLKGYPSGILIVIDENASMEQILAEVAVKFKDSEKFFGKAKKTISFEGRKNTLAEEQKILDVIQESCELDIACILSKENDIANKLAIREVEKRVKPVLSDVEEETMAQFYKGSLGARKVLETDRSVVILGDVNSGAVVVSKKNIIVLGTLYGSAHAGIDDKPHFILALSMDPEAIRIGEFKGKYKTKKGFGAKKDTRPKVAYVKDGTVVFEDLNDTEELLGYLSE